MKILKSLLLLPLLLLFTISCSSGGGDSTPAEEEPEVQAPSSFTGKLFRITVTSGTGFFYSSGSFEVDFSATDNSYIITGIAPNTFNSAGTYTYTSSGNEGTIMAMDSTLSSATFTYSFTSETEGYYEATVSFDPNSRQTGTFVEVVPVGSGRASLN